MVWSRPYKSCSFLKGLLGAQMGSRGLWIHMAWRVAVGMSREASEEPEEAGSVRSAGRWTGACSWPPFLTDLLRLFPACVGTQAPSSGSPAAAVRHTLSAFPRTVPSGEACTAPLPPSAHTLALEGVCSRRGARTGGSVRSLSAWL